MVDELDAIKTGALQRRLALSLAGAKSGSKFALGALRNVGRSSEARKQANEQLLLEQADAFVKELGKLKGAYVKIGQMLAIYGEHVLPPAFVASLKTLNAQTTPLAWSSIQPVIHSALGEQIADHLIIRPQALAAASLSQVHKAHWVDGEADVVVKVQYPGVADAIDNDFADVIRLLRLTHSLAKSGHSQTILDDIKAQLKQETDYTRELATMAWFKEKLQGDNRYFIPASLPEYSSDKVLTMEWVDGVPLDAAEVKSLSNACRKTLAIALLELFFKEVFEWHTMQTDPNLGNYLVRITGDRAELCLLDFGAVRQFEPAFMVALANTMLAAVARDQQGIVLGLTEMGFFTDNSSEFARSSFASLCELLVEPFRPHDKDTPVYAINAQGEYLWGQSNLVKRSAKLAANFAMSRHFSPPPPEFTLLTRKLSGLYGAIAGLDVAFNSADLLQRYARAASLASST